MPDHHGTPDSAAFRSGAGFSSERREPLEAHTTTYHMAPFVPEISYPPATIHGLTCPACGPQDYVTMVKVDLERETCSAGWCCASCGGRDYAAGGTPSV